MPGTTPFIHRDTNFFLLEDLRPDTEYKVDVYLIPVPLAEKELASDDVLTFRTKAKIPGSNMLLNFKMIEYHCKKSNSLPIGVNLFLIF